MQFNIPMRTKDAVTTSSLRQTYQTANTTPCMTVSRQGIRQEQPTSQPAAPPVTRPVQPTPPPPQRTTPVQPAAPAQRTVQHQKQPLGGTILQRGQKFSIAGQNGASVSNIRIGLDWALKNPALDLDASAFLLGGNEMVLGDDWFVFYGQSASPDGSVRYFDKDSAQPGEMAALEIRLSAVRPEVEKIVIAVTIYEAIQNRYNFSMVQYVTASILDSVSKRPLAGLDLTDGSPAVTALVVGELYRYKGSWKFNAVGSGVGKDLAGFCGMYGVNMV